MKKLLLMVALVAISTHTFSQECPCMSDEELITNGDFESGLTGFSTDYVEGVSELESSYMVTNYTQNKIPYTSSAYCHTYDHTTPGTVSGDLFAFETTESPTVEMLNQTVNIDANADYCFSIWTFKVKDNEPPKIRVTLTDGVNTVLIHDAIDFPSGGGVSDCFWMETTVSFNSGMLSGACQLILDDYSDTKTFAAIDDISLHKELDETDLPLTIPDVVCKEDGCVTLTEGTPGEYSASGSGVASVMDIFGNEYWRFCPDALEVGVYTIEVCITGSPDCCIDVEIEVVEPDLSSISTEYCAGTSNFLSNPSVGGTWSGDYVLGGPDDFSFSPPSEGIYTLTWTDADGCSAIINVEAFATSFTVVEVTGTCDGSNGSISLVSDDGTLYEWSISGPVIENAVGFSEVTFDDLPSGTYFVSATLIDEPYCSSWTTVEISEGTSEWPKTTSDTYAEDHSVDVCNDLSGNTFITGDFMNETSFDGLTIDYLSPKENMYMASYDACGSLRFVATASGGSVTASRIAIDTDYERVYVVGTFSATTTFNTGVAEDGSPVCVTSDITLVSGTDQGVFVAVYNTNGCLLHVEKIDAPAGTYLEGEAIAASDFVDMSLDMNHRVYFATKQTTFGGTETELTVYSCNPNPSSPYDFSYEWVESITSAGKAWINDMDNQNGNIALVGSFEYNLLHDENLLSVSDFRDGFVYNWLDNGSSALPLFEKDLFAVGSSAQHGDIFTLTMEDDAIIVGGEYSGPISSAFGALYLAPASPSLDAGFVAYLDFSGTPDWIHSISSDISASVKSMDSEGNRLYIGGEFSGEDYYENNSLVENSISANHTFVSRWKQSIGPFGSWTNISSPLVTSATTVKTNTGLTSYDNLIYTTGDYSQSMDFTITSVGPLNASPMINTNAYLWRLQHIDGEAKTLLSQSNDVASPKEMVIYPNPTDGKVTIEVQDKTNLSKYEISSASGGNIQSGSFIGLSELDLSNLRSGIYFIRVENSNGIYLERLAIK